MFWISFVGGFVIGGFCGFMLCAVLTEGLIEDYREIICELNRCLAGTTEYTGKARQD